MAAFNLRNMYTVGRGVTRSKRRAMQWLRKAAVNGDAEACMVLADQMYADRPCAREIGHVVESTGVATSAEVTEGHDVPLDVLDDVGHWLRKLCMTTGQSSLSSELEHCRKIALQGAQYCINDGCEVVGQLKDFKVCPQCKTARYCGDACQKEDWTTGEHKETCRQMTR
jgi:TPR repeat protein